MKLKNGLKHDQIHHFNYIFIIIIYFFILLFIFNIIYFLLLFIFYIKLYVNILGDTDIASNSCINNLQA